MPKAEGCNANERTAGTPEYSDNEPNETMRQSLRYHQGIITASFEELKSWITICGSSNIIHSGC